MISDLCLAAAALLSLAEPSAPVSDLAPRAASQFVPLASEPPPKLHVDPPLAAPLARGAAIIPYRVENLRLMPVLGSGGLSVSPRVGHLHVTVNDLPWRWADASGDDTIVIVGLPPGPHKVLLELADPEHKIYTSKAVTFTIPATASAPP